MKSQMRPVLLALLCLAIACGPQPEVRRFSGTHPGGVLCLRFFPGDRYAISSGVDQTARVWEVASGREVRRFSGPQHRFQNIAISAGGQTAVTPSPDGVRYWRLDTGADVRSLSGASPGAATVALAPDGARIAAAGFEPAIEVFDAHSGQRTASLQSEGPVVQVAFASPDRLFSIERTGRFCVWNLPQGTPEACAAATDEPVSAAAFSRDARLLAVGSSYGTLRVWDTVSRTFRRLEGANGDIVALGFSIAAHELLSGGADKIVRLWDTGTGMRTREQRASGNYVSAVAFGGNRLALFGSDDGSMALWRLP